MPTPTPMPETPYRVQDAAREREAAAMDQLSRVHGALGLHTAVLALLLPTGSRRALQAWQAETAALPGAAALRAHIECLSPAARLPWLEVLLVRMRGQALATRQTLLESTRRVMAAHGVVRPLDRLHWLLMRQRLGGASAATVHAAAQADLSRLPQSDVLAVARYSAFLSRMVPVEAGAKAHEGAQAEALTGIPAELPADISADIPAELPGKARTPGATAAPAGVAWYATVMARWERHASVPPCEPPDSDALVHALQELQALAWMQRPVLARDWVTAALKHSPRGRLADTAADALRLSCALLDSPLPPELERHFQAAVRAMPR